MAHLGSTRVAVRRGHILTALLLLIGLPACLDRDGPDDQDDHDSGAHAPSTCSVDAGLDASMAPEPDPAPPPEEDVYVEVGIPDPETDSGWVPLAPDGEVKVDTFGQGGYHAEISIAFRGFGDEVYPQLIILNMEDDGIVDTPIPPRTQPVACDPDGRCTDSRIFVMLGGLADIEELDGLRVRIIAVIMNDEGVRGEDAREATLRMVQR